MSPSKHTSNEELITFITKSLILSENSKYKHSTAVSIVLLVGVGSSLVKEWVGSNDRDVPSIQISNTTDVRLLGVFYMLYMDIVWLNDNIDKVPHIALFFT